MGSFLLFVYFCITKKTVRIILVIFLSYIFHKKSSHGWNWSLDQRAKFINFDINCLFVLKEVRTSPTHVRKYLSLHCYWYWVSSAPLVFSSMKWKWYWFAFHFFTSEWDKVSYHGFVHISFFHSWAVKIFKLTFICIPEAVVNVWNTFLVYIICFNLLYALEF